MKTAVSIAFFVSLAVAPACASAQSKEECEGKVMAAIKMLQIRSMMKGTEQKHGDLSIADIERIQKTKGSCAAAQEIDKRTKAGAKVSLF